MSELAEQFKRLPKWAQIGVPIALVAVVWYVYSRNKSSSSGTLTEAATGSAADNTASGAAAGETVENTYNTTYQTTNNNGTTKPTNPGHGKGEIPPHLWPPHGITPTPSPKPTPNGTYAKRLAAWKAEALKWQKQYNVDVSKKGGKKEKNYAEPGKNTTLADWEKYASEMKHNAYASMGKPYPTRPSKPKAAQGAVASVTVPAVAKTAPLKSTVPQRQMRLTSGLTTTPPKTVNVASKRAPQANVTQSKSRTVATAHHAPIRKESPRRH